MRKIVFFAHANTVGTGTQELVLFDDNVTTKELDEYAQEFGMEHANAYDRGFDEEDEYEDEDAYYDDYYAQCGWWWEDYDPAKHNGNFCGIPEGYEED
jgi:hypothetical protein